VRSGLPIVLIELFLSLLRLRRLRANIK